MFKNLFTEILSGLRGARNNDLAKWLNYKIMQKNIDLFNFICGKNKIEININDAKCVERASSCLLDDHYVK